MRIEKDFVEDIRLGLTAELEQLGYALPSATADARSAAHTVCVQHWNAHARRIAPRPRTVHRSVELATREAQLSPVIKRGLAAVEAEIHAGTDLTVRLSRRLRKLGFNDAMLNDWGLHHLHLDGTNRAAEGTPEVLILLLRAEDAYLIDVRPHGHWADRDLVEIVHGNWPAVIARYRLPEILGLTRQLTDEQHKNLRDKSCNTPIQTRDGAVYMAIGGGMASTGVNVSAVRWGDWLLGQATTVSEFLDTHSTWLEGVIVAALKTRPDHVRLHLLNVSRDQAILVFEHAGAKHGFTLPIVPPIRNVVDLTMPRPSPVESPAR